MKKEWLYSAIVFVAVAGLSVSDLLEKNENIHGTLENMHDTLKDIRDNK